MRTRVRLGLVFAATAATLSGCGFFDHEEREPWRGQAEAQCLAQGRIVPTAFTRPIEEIEGPGVCGVDKPFRVYGLADGSVGVQPSARLGCPLTAALDGWVRDAVQPAAMARFGAGVAELKNMASYGCRTRNNRKGAKLSEHAFGNGLDIGAFMLVDGREISVLKDWRKGTPEAQAFLREVFGKACGTFRTVLGPGSDGFHENHFHFDLARHDARGTRSYCRPRPEIPELPPAPSLGDDVPMAYRPDANWPVARAPQTPAAGALGYDGPTGSVGRRAPVEDPDRPPFGWEPDE